MSDEPAIKIDIDAFLDEALGPPKVITMFGRDWTLVKEMPAGLKLKIARMEDAQFITAELERLLLESVVGPEQADQMLDLGIGERGVALFYRVAEKMLEGYPPEIALRLATPELADTADEAGEDAEGN